MSKQCLLVDRHHADLLYSLQRLFDDRLKIPVYIPLGYEWWDEKYWQFGQCFGDNRLAQQYLQISDGIWDPIGDGIYVTHDTAHPDRSIFGITLEGFRDQGQDFGYVMATVQENQTGFKRIADEVGARYLVGVGNTGQYIDWSLDPFIINSSEAPIPEGKGVTIHQEIDSQHGGAFGWSVPPFRSSCTTVRNAVNAFNRIPGYDKFLAAEAALAGWYFTIHGHEGRDGDINPVSALGELMRTAGWGWHDKPVGDGFGHVIHSWAAVGRPLIGHAEYYRGKLAAPFWKDGVTCLDLGARPLDETIGLMREIALNPNRHLAMCMAIRSTFDGLVDYEAEAAEVALRLGI